MPVYADKARGRFVFEFDVRIDKRRIRARKILPKSWNRTQADAFDRKESGRLYAQVRAGERAAHTIDDAVAAYGKHRCPELKNGDNCIREISLTHWAYHGKPLTELAEVCREIAREGREITNERDKPLSAATIRNRIRYLTAACRYAWKAHGMGEHDPAERVVVPTVRNERQFYIVEADMKRLANAAQNRAASAAIRIAFYSGMRMSEILRAERRGNTFVLADSKNGKPRHVPIHPKIRTAALVPLTGQSSISRHFRKARKALGMDWLHFHDLRHSAASAMINNQVDLYTVGAVLGHRSSASTQRYAHLATDSLRDAISKIGGQNIPHRKKARAA